MKRTLCSLILCLPFIIHAQTDTSSKGINWAETLTWEQVKQKARLENKYIFIDAYTTWCGPCKMMDKYVYVDPMVSKYLNEKFVSIKVQMDTTKKDDDKTIKWYADAHSISKDYKIGVFPTFLFLTPDGKLVHRDLGFKNVEAFVELIRKATDLKSQYYSLLNDYKSGKKDYSIMPYLANTTNKLGESELAKAIAKDYLENYLYKKSNKELLKKESIFLIKSFVQESKGKGFELFLKKTNEINKIVDKQGYAESFVENIIHKEEVKPIFDQWKLSNVTPDWKLLSSTIAKKYSVYYADRSIIKAQLQWYRARGDWPALANYNIKYIEKYGLDTTGVLKSYFNNIFWEVYFIHCNDISQLNKVINWMEFIVKSDPYDAVNLDTYANLLYKVGRSNEGIRYQTLAVKLDTEDKGMKKSLESMKNGEPTYLHSGAIWDNNTLSKLEKRKPSL